MTRRDLMKGGAGTCGARARLAGGGLRRRRRGCCPSEPAAAPPSGEALPAPPADAPKFTGTLRVTGLGVDLIDLIKAAGEAAPALRLRRHRLGDDGAEGDHAAGLVRRLLRLHVPVQPGVPGGQLPQGDREAHLLGADVPAITQGKVDPASTTCTYGGRRRALPHSVHRPGEDRQLAELVGDAERAGRPARPWVDEATGQTVGDEPLYTIGPPNNFNMDSMGYNADVIAQEPEAVDWPEPSTPATRAGSRC